MQSRICHVVQCSHECIPHSTAQPRVYATFLSTAKHVQPCSVQPRICHIPELGIVRGRVMFIWMTKCQWIFAHFLLVTASNPRHLRQRTEPESPSKTTPAQREEALHSRQIRTSRRIVWPERKEQQTSTSRWRQLYKQVAAPGVGREIKL